MKHYVHDVIMDRQIDVTDTNTKAILFLDDAENETANIANVTVSYYSPTMTHMAIVVYLVVHPVLILVGTFGNCLTIETLRRQKKKVASSYLLMGLAVSDILTLVVKSVFMVYRWGELFKSDIVNSFAVSSHFLLRLPTTPARVGRTFIVTLSVERVIAVWTPLKAHSSASHRKSISLVISLFVLVVLIDVGSMGQLIKAEIQDNQHKLPALQKALDYMHTSERIWKYYRLFMAIVFDISPMVAVIICNCLIVAGLKITVKNFCKEENSTYEIRLIQEKRITKMLFVNSVVFFILTTPHCANQLIMDFKLTNSYKDMSSEAVIGIALTCLCLETANYSVNFIIYGITNSTFRKQYLQVLTSCCRGTRMEIFSHIESNSISERSTQSDRVASLKNSQRSNSSGRGGVFSKNKYYSIKPLICGGAETGQT